MEKKEKKEDILISIIIPTFNREKTIKRALLSVLNQTYKNIEIIVIDDGSTDKTKNIVDNLNNKIGKNKIKYFYQENSGVSSARNLGVLKSKGEYISFLDSDDEYLPQKIEKHLFKIIKNKSFFSLCQEIQIRDNIYTRKRYIKKESLLLNIDNFLKIFPPHSASLFFIKKEVFLNYSFDKKQISLNDTDFILRYLQKNNILLIRDVLVKRYKDLKENRLSSDPNKKIEGLIMIISKIMENFYTIDDVKVKNSFLFSLYYQLAIFNILNKNIKEAQNYFLIAKNIKKISFAKKIKSFFIFIFLYIPFSNLMIFYFGKLLWKFRIIEVK